MIEDNLQATELANFNDARVQRKIRELSIVGGTRGQQVTSFAGFVREHIQLEIEQRPLGIRASEVLCFGRGSALGKTVLFTALCRGAGLPCRIRFQRLSGAPPRWLSVGRLPRFEWESAHPLAEVQVDNKWVAVDVSLDSASASRVGLKMPFVDGLARATLAEALPWGAPSLVARESVETTDELLEALIQLTTASFGGCV